MMRLIAEGYPVYVRMPAELELRLEQVATEAGYSRSLLFRKLLDGALNRLDLGENRRDLVLALNRWSKIR